MIDLSNTDAVRAYRPFLVAHRGGVIAPNAPECSLAAIRLAAEHGYQMVELDAQEAQDSEPIVFHDRTLTKSCGLDKQINAITSGEIQKICHRASDQHIATLAEALALCKSLNLWVMLDVKTFTDVPNSERFFQRIGELLEQNGLTQTTVTISGHHLVLKHLVDKTLFKVTHEELVKIQEGKTVSLKRKFWFGLPEKLPSEMVPKLQKNGALVIPAINTFRYPVHAHQELARQDVERLLEAGVDGFQIDSVYEELFSKKQ